LKKSILSVLYIAITSYCCIGQIIKNVPIPIEIGLINFNPEIIKQNKVKEIEIKVVNKPDGSFIVDKGTAYGYKFDPEGYLIRYYYTVFNKLAAADKKSVHSTNAYKIEPFKDMFKYINDTIFTDVTYDELNRISCKRIKTDNVYDAFYYSYNSDNQLIKEVHYKETNTGKNLDDFKLGTQELVFSQTFQYKVLSTNQTKKICLNIRGMPYKNTFIKWDAKKNLINETSESTVTSMRQEYNYSYSAANQLIKKNYKSNEKASVVLESVYEYGKNGNLISEKKYKNEGFVYETNFIYDENGVFIRSEANRNHTSSTVFIAKYNYLFYK
jgi:hypothetical protein